MTPEEQKKLTDLMNRVVKLESDNRALRNSTTIPFDIDAAFRDRFSNIQGLKVSSKNVDSEDQTVNEGGASTYAVLGDPDGFLEVEIEGTTRYLPYY